MVLPTLGSRTAKEQNRTDVATVVLTNLRDLIRWQFFFQSFSLASGARRVGSSFDAVLAVAMPTVALDRVSQHQVTHRTQELLVHFRAAEDLHRITSLPARG